MIKQEFPSIKPAKKCTPPLTTDIVNETSNTIDDPERIPENDKSVTYNPKNS